MNYIYRRRNENQSRWFIKDFVGTVPPTLSELKEIIQSGNTSFIEKLLYYGKCVPGSASYWRSKKAELYSWINHHIEQRRGGPTLFLTLSCAEYFWPDLKRLLQDFVLQCEGKKIDFDVDHNAFNIALNDFAVVVQEFFHLRVNAFLEHIGLKLFGIKHYWGRFEFAKSRGQIHLHLLGIVEEASDVNGIYRQIHQFKNDKEEQAKLLAAWARKKFNMTAEINNDVKTNEADYSPCKIHLFETKSLQQDQFELCMFCHMHQCSDYCLVKKKKKKTDSPTAVQEIETPKRRNCRMGCGMESKPGNCDTPGWPLIEKDIIGKDPRGFKKLCLKRNHPRFNQTSLYCLQSWRANCDVSILVYESDPMNPNLAEIANVTNYVITYACKGNATYEIEKKQVQDFTLR